MEVTILGNSSATPTASRNQSAQVLSLTDRNYLLDCGENVQAQLLKSGVNQNKVKQVFISHLHPDHFTGLIGFITSQNLQHRQQPLQVYGPEGLEDIIRTQLFHSDANLRFDLQFNPISTVKDGGLLFEDHQLEVRVLNLVHRIPCFGFVFREKFQKQKLSKEAIKKAPPPVEAYQYLEQGKNYTDKAGNTYSAKFYALANPLAKSFAYITDTSLKEELIPYLKDVGTLYHEATFDENLKGRAHKTCHSTAKEAATIASKAGVKELIIGHFSARYNNLDILLNEARKVFEETYLAIQGEKFIIKENSENLV